MRKTATYKKGGGNVCLERRSDSMMAGYELRPLSLERMNTQFGWLSPGAKEEGLSVSPKVWQLNDTLKRTI